MANYTNFKAPRKKMIQRRGKGQKTEQKETAKDLLDN